MSDSNREDSGERKGKANSKAISLHPPKLKEALAALLATKPEPKGEDTQQKEQGGSK